MKSELLPLVALDSLAEGHGKRVCVAGLDLAVFRVGDAMHALDDSCPHAGASLSTGMLRDGAVACPAHGLRFDVRTGCVVGAADLRTPSYPLRVVDGVVMLVREPANEASQRDPA